MELAGDFLEMKVLDNICNSYGEKVMSQVLNL